MVYQFNGAIDHKFPVDAERPLNRQTFMLTGIGVTWEDSSGTPTAPTTAGTFVLGIDADHNDVEMSMKVTSVDPTTPTPSLTNWFELLEDGPVALPAGCVARVIYTNADSLVVKVAFLGYWR